MWRLAVPEQRRAVAPTRPTPSRSTRATHRLIDRVTDEYERWSYNTAVAALMEFTNLLYKQGTTDRRHRHAAAAAGADGAAHHRRAVGAPPPGERRPRAALAARPTPTWLALRPVTMVVQVNGKVRDRIEVDPGIDEAEAERLALASTKVQAHLDGATPRKVIARPPSLVNIVVS